MKMLRITSLDDYNQLPLTSWNIKQPASEGITLMSVLIDYIMWATGDDGREDSLTEGLDLIVMPGLGFTKVMSFGHMILWAHMIHNNRMVKE